MASMAQFDTQYERLYSAIPEEHRPGHVICLIMTDGMENASHEWDWGAVQKLTKQQQDEWNWKFIFIGANIDEGGDRRRPGDGDEHPEWQAGRVLR
ncbi:hypothetical protein A6B34_27135 [Mycolicibacterium monacense]|nr:hypothetical protein A6B34_27135 [Mycolicibacterium monacense]